jgi:hypothetical protein
MGSVLCERVSRWAETLGIEAGRVPAAAQLSVLFQGEPEPCRPGIDARAIDEWDRRHGYALPASLREWLLLSNGLYTRKGPLIHPLSAIGPMVPFARMPEIVVQPESWFELGNPNIETVCVDLGYRWPGEDGGAPIFTSGDDQTGSRPRVIAVSFEAWFLQVLGNGGEEYWFRPGFEDLGDPWEAHRRLAPAPPLPDRLRVLAPRVRGLMRPGADDRGIASTLGISRGDVEVLFRHLQHVPDRHGVP